MAQNLNPTIKGVTVTNDILEAAFAQVPRAGFDKAQFAAAMQDAGQAEASNGDFTRRLMQYLKRQGMISYDLNTALWSLTSLGHMQIPNQTLPLLSVQQVATLQLPKSNRSWAEFTSNLFQTSLCHLACLGTILALIILNASFAWELGSERGVFQLAFVVALIALDLMRPFLIAASLWSWEQGKILRGALAIAVTLSLSPVSILSTTSILSASFQLGAELNHNAATQEETRVALQAEHERLLNRAAKEEKDWQVECARGGCGPKAAKLERQFQTTIAETKDILNRILTINDKSQGQSKLLARMVTTFEELGLFGGNRQVLLPLLLALSLELGALFGPALLLTRNKP